MGAGSRRRRGREDTAVNAEAVGRRGGARTAGRAGGDRSEPGAGSRRGSVGGPRPGRAWPAGGPAESGTGQAGLAAAGVAHLRPERRVAGGQGRPGHRGGRVHPQPGRGLANRAEQAAADRGFRSDDRGGGGRRESHTGSSSAEGNCRPECRVDATARRPGWSHRAGAAGSGRGGAADAGTAGGV